MLRPAVAKIQPRILHGNFRNVSRTTEILALLTARGIPPSPALNESCSQVEWDTDPGTREVQWIKTYASTGPNEIQSITTTAYDVDEVQQLNITATVVQEVQVTVNWLLCWEFILCCWRLRVMCFRKMAPPSLIDCCAVVHCYLSTLCPNAYS